MLGLIRTWELSGLSQKDFCINNNISLSTFGYWRKQYLKDQKPKVKAFKQINLPSRIDRELKITYPNGVSLRLTSDIDKNELAKLIRCLD